MTFHQTDSATIESTVQATLASQNVILSLSLPTERKRIAIAQIVQRVGKGLPVICVASDRTIENEIRNAPELQPVIQAQKEQDDDDTLLWSMVGRDEITHFRLVTPDEFCNISHAWQVDLFSFPVPGLLIVMDFDLLSFEDRGKVEDGMVSWLLRDGHEVDAHAQILVTMSPLWDVLALTKLLNATILEFGDADQDTTRQPLALTMNEPDVFDQFILGEADHWKHSTDARMEALFSHVLRYANSNSLLERRNNLVEQRFIDMIDTSAGQSKLMYKIHSVDSFCD